MFNSGVSASGSTFLEFEDVEVPVENLIGTENKGFEYIMSSTVPLQSNIRGRIRSNLPR